MAKKVIAELKLQLRSGYANPVPPVGPILGQAGVNIMEFCKQFNERTTGKFIGLEVPVVITVYHDKSFAFVIKSPVTADLLCRAAGIAIGSHKPGSETAGTVTWAQCLEIAKIKEKDLNARTPEAGAKMIAGTARSMGIKVEGMPAKVV